ncbi:MAG: MBL fold metallo-hydrolase [Streptosporangiales bacterium]|nr:MBL fold metallo-hydrolase [Streptosporangiales bacterium]
MSLSAERPSRAASELHPGIWHLPVPLTGHSIGHVNVYALVTAEGPLLVDTGWGTPETFTALTALLRDLGAEPADVRGVVSTHMHPDHCGLARTLRDAGGAWFAMHEVDARGLREVYADRPAHVEANLRWLREAGAPGDYAPRMVSRLDEIASRATGLAPDRPLADGDTVSLGDWDLAAVHTPGHTPGHLCLFEQKTGTLFTGDHVLTRINASPTYRPGTSDDPVGDYLASLDRLASLPVRRTLPGHQRPIADLAARLTEVRAYHERRIAQVTGAVRAGSRTAWETAATLTRSRPWPELSETSRVVAVGETYAHLRHVALRGEVVAHDGEPVRWTAV